MSYAKASPVRGRASPSNGWIMIIHASAKPNYYAAFAGTNGWIMMMQGDMEKLKALEVEESADEDLAVERNARDQALAM